MEGESKQLLVLGFNVRQVDLGAADQDPGQDGLCGSSSLDTSKVGPRMNTQKKEVNKPKNTVTALLELFYHICFRMRNHRVVVMETDCLAPVKIQMLELGFSCNRQ